MLSLQQIKDRKLVQWAIAYLAGAWVLLQVVQVVSQAFGWPPVVQQALIIVLGVGFPTTLVLAWYHGEQGRQRVGGVELMMLAALLVLAGAGLTFVSSDDSNDVVAHEVSSDPEQGSIAVLPFVNMTSDREQDYFSDGLTEELLNVLAQVPGLRVAARTSSFSFKGKDVPVDSIARVLHVENVVEGSVRRSGNRVRITAQLVSAKNGYHLWSSTYDRTVDDIFAVQDEISRAIVSALKVKLTGVGSEPLAKQATTDPEAHTLALRALAARRGGTSEAIVQAVSLYRQAVQRDPRYARAWAGLADALAVAAYRKAAPPEKAYADAKAAAKRALELDPELADAHLALAVITQRRDWDFKAADQHFRRALELNPNLAETYRRYSWLLMRLGRRDEAIAAARRSIALDPASVGPYNDGAVVFAFSGDFETALQMLDGALALSPAHPIVLANKALMLSDVNRFPEAIATAERATAREVNAFSVSTLAYVLAKAGRTADAERELARLRKLPDVGDYLYATVYAGLGRTDQMFEQLERAVENRDDAAIELPIDFVFTPYRNDPRMKALVRKMGL